MNLTLLGPQRRTGGARAALADLIPHGPVATINAGWQEREGGTRELDEVLGGRMVNLELYRRWRDLVGADPEYSVAERELSRRLDELRTAYRLRLDHALAAARALAQRVRDPEILEVSTADAVDTVRALDDWHVARSAALREDFYRTVRLGERETVLAHRRGIADRVADSAGIVLAGGHVGVLLHLLHVFGVAALLRPPLIAWSAGAMALAERVVLFHDRTADGRRPAEVYAEGLGVYPGVVPFPHPRRRLRLHDGVEIDLLVRRLHPRTGVLFDDGVRLDLRDGEPLPPGARPLGTG